MFIVGRVTRFRIAPARLGIGLDLKRRISTISGRPLLIAVAEYQSRLRICQHEFQPFGWIFWIQRQICRSSFQNSQQPNHHLRRTLQRISPRYLRPTSRPSNQTMRQPIGSSFNSPYSVSLPHISPPPPGRFPHLRLKQRRQRGLRHSGSVSFHSSNIRLRSCRPSTSTRPTADPLGHYASSTRTYCRAICSTRHRQTRSRLYNQLTRSLEPSQTCTSKSNRTRNSAPRNRLHCQAPSFRRRHGHIL